MGAAPENQTTPARISVAQSVVKGWTSVTDLNRLSEALHVRGSPEILLQCLALEGENVGLLVTFLSQSLNIDEDFVGTPSSIFQT